MASIIKLDDRSQLTSQNCIERGKEVISVEADALAILASCLDESFAAACDLLLESKGRVVVTGMGKSGHIGRKVAATLAATGTPAIYVHPAEAAHGDLGMLVPDDVMIVISNSGATSELRAILQYAKGIGVRMVGIASNPDSLVMQHSDVRLCLPAVREACSANVAPTTSTTLQLALGDALALSVMDARGFTKDGMKSLHPGGTIGLRLTEVRELMHSGDLLPLVEVNTPMKEVVSTMTSKGFGIAGVVDYDQNLLGVITDGDLRRHFSELGTASAGLVMTPTPKTVSGDMLAEDALMFMNDTKITAAFVMDPAADGQPSRPLGIVHIHDFIRLGMS